MRIGELAQRADCDVETVRFYEREGLLAAPARELNGYRRYTEAHLVQRNFIRHCRSLEIGLPDVRTLLGLQMQPAVACDEVNDLIDHQIERIHQQLESLQRLEQQLHALRDSCNANKTASECGILRNLEQAAEGEPCQCHEAEPSNKSL